MMIAAALLGAAPNRRNVALIRIEPLQRHNATVTSRGPGLAHGGKLRLMGQMRQDVSPGSAARRVRARALVGGRLDSVPLGAGVSVSDSRQLWSGQAGIVEG